MIDSYQVLLAAGQEVAALSAGDIHSLRSHPGPSVLLLHGMANTSVVWTPLLEQWTSPSKIVAVDIPGHGGSSARGIRICTRNVSGILEAFARRYLPPPVLVVGHSLGSVLGLEMALQGSDFINGCLMFSGPLVPMMELYTWPLHTLLRDKRPVVQLAAMVLAGLVPGLPSLLRRRSQTSDGIDRLLAGQVGNLESLSASTKALAVRDLGKGRVAATALGGFGYDHMSAYRGLGARCRSIVGSKDPNVFKEDVLRFFARVLPAADFEEWEGVGHLPMLERQSQTLSAVLDFLALVNKSDLGGRVGFGPMGSGDIDVVA